jgi:hypothetical protein
MIHFWRYFQTDAKFHAFEAEGKRSVCGYHESNKNIQPVAERFEIPREVVCPFCTATIRRERRRLGVHPSG